MADTPIENTDGITTDDVRGSLDVAVSNEDGENGDEQNEENQGSDGDGDGDPSNEDGDSEVNTDSEGENEEDDGEEDAGTDSETSSSGDDEEDGEETEVQITAEHEVGASIQKFMSENIAPERVEEGLNNFKTSLSIVADQMSGNYENYWSGLTPSLEQAAIDNPDMFIDTLAPLYQKVLEGEGRMLTAENKRSVDNMEISEDFALKMQKQDRKLELTQRKNGMFEKRDGQDRESREVQAHETSLVLSARETFEAMESMYPASANMRAEITKSIAEEGASTPREVKLLIENAYHNHAKTSGGNKQGSRQIEKKPLRSNRSSVSAKVVDNPNMDFTHDEIAASLKS